MRFASLAAQLHLLEQCLLPAECLLCHRPVETAAGDRLICATVSEPVAPMYRNRSAGAVVSPKRPD